MLEKNLEFMHFNTVFSASGIGTGNMFHIHAYMYYLGKLVMHWKMTEIKAYGKLWNEHRENIYTLYGFGWKFYSICTEQLQVIDIGFVYSYDRKN